MVTVGATINNSDRRLVAISEDASRCLGTATAQCLREIIEAMAGGMERCPASWIDRQLS